MACQSDCKNVFMETTEKLLECLLSRQFCHQEIIEHLEVIPTVLSQYTKMNWNTEIQNLVLSIKIKVIQQFPPLRVLLTLLCTPTLVDALQNGACLFSNSDFLNAELIFLSIVYHDPEFSHLFLYDEKTSSIDKNIVDGMELSKKACEVLSLLSERLNGKESYGLLYSMVESVGSPSYKFEELVKFCPVDGNLRISQYIMYADVFNLLKTIVFRTKSILACAESRRTNEQLFELTDVPFTSLSVEMASILKELLALGLKILSEHNFLTTTNQLDLDTVGNFVVEVANSCPFERLDSDVFDNLSQYISKFHLARPKLYSRKTFTSLCNVLMKHDPEITGNMMCLLEDKPLFLDGDEAHYANSVLVDCYRSITVWLCSVHLGSPYMSDRSQTAESELKLLATLCKTKAFSAGLSRNVSVLLKLVLSILRASSTLESNHLKGLYGVCDPSTSMNVVVNATNLLCMIIKLCSQHATEESCSWNSVDNDESCCDSTLNEFVCLWTMILELMPTLVESQTSSIPNGVLNSIAEFGESLFNLLRETSLQRMIITTVLVYCSSTLKSEVRAKAGRALARLIEFKCLSESMGFSMDAFDMIKMNMKAKEQSVRISFSWAFGNWSDVYLQECLVIDNEDDNMMVHHRMVSDFHAVIRNSYEAKAKVKYNIFRGAGNLLKFVQRLDAEIAPKIKDVIHILIEQVGKGFDFKARWNACHALRNVFTNECLLKYLDPEVKSRTMQCFIKNMYQSENFKERIQCVLGASSLTSRNGFGEFYLILWDKLVNAVAVEPPELLSEVEQAEKLNVEVGRAYINLITVLKREDLQRLEEIVAAKWEGIQSAISLSLETTPLDDVHLFECAARNMENLMKLNLRPYELEMCKIIYWTLFNRQYN